MVVVDHDLQVVASKDLGKGPDARNLARIHDDQAFHGLQIDVLELDHVGHDALGRGHQVIAYPFFL